MSGTTQGLVINSIPADQIVKIIPDVISGGGNALDLSGLFITDNPRLSLGPPVLFASAIDVVNLFGSLTPEAQAATTYFNGFTGATASPKQIFFSRYPAVAASGYLKGAKLGTTDATILANLKLLTPGTMSVNVDGIHYTSNSINVAPQGTLQGMAEAVSAAFTAASTPVPVGPTLATATVAAGCTFSAVSVAGQPTQIRVTTVVGNIYPPYCTLTGTGIAANTTIASQVSGTKGGAGVYTLNKAVSLSSATAITGSSQVLDVISVTAGSAKLNFGQLLTGVGIPVSTYLSNQRTVATGSVAGKIGTYYLNKIIHVVAETATLTRPFCSWDEPSKSFILSSPTAGYASSVGFADDGPISSPMGLSASTGASPSLGSDPQDPYGFMTNLLTQLTDWFSFTTTFDPDGTPGVNDQKLIFAQWCNDQRNRFWYVPWDQDQEPTVSTAASNSLGYQINVVNSYSGITPVWSNNSTAQGAANDGPAKAAFLMGWAASPNTGARNGRTVLAFRNQSGLVPDVTNSTVAANLLANGYCFYERVATANQRFTFMWNGQVSGPFNWADSYADQVWMSNQFQLILLSFLTQASSIPYNQVGYTMIKGACMTVINAAINFGAIRPGVTLSPDQVVLVNSQAGMKIDDVLSTQGWFLQVQDASAQVRAARASPPVLFWWMDGQSVQQITLSSFSVQ